MNITIHRPDKFQSGEPGLYRDVPDDEYFAFDAASNSRLSQLAKSPAHCYAAINGVWSDTEALRFGSAAHAAVLQPMEYATRYTTFVGDLRSKAAKEEFAELRAKFGDRNVLRGDAQETIAEMVTAVRQHRAARTILDLPGPSEVVALWKHEQTGLLCKMKVDHYAVEAAVLIDYKTTTDASPDAFSRSIHNYGYHRQGAFYIMGMRSLGIDMKDFVLIAQEKTAPFAVSACRIHDFALEAGRDELEQLLTTYAECKSSGHWPGYDDGKIIDIDLPEWYYKRKYNEEINV